MDEGDDAACGCEAPGADGAAGDHEFLVPRAVQSLRGWRPGPFDSWPWAVPIEECVRPVPLLVEADLASGGCVALGADFWERTLQRCPKGRQMVHSLVAVSVEDYFAPPGPAQMPVELRMWCLGAAACCPQRTPPLVSGEATRRNLLPPSGARLQFASAGAPPVEVGPVLRPGGGARVLWQLPARYANGIHLAWQAANSHPGCRAALSRHRTPDGTYRLPLPREGEPFEHPLLGVVLEYLPRYLPGRVPPGKDDRHFEVGSETVTTFAGHMAEKHSMGPCTVLPTASDTFISLQPVRDHAYLARAMSSARQNPAKVPELPVAAHLVLWVASLPAVPGQCSDL